MPINTEQAMIIRANVIAALAEDIGGGDLTALLVPENSNGHATVITREHAVVCGRAWFDACFKILDSHCSINWFVREGQKVAPNEKLCEIKGDARVLLTAERTALNFLQTLSATATLTHQFVVAARGTRAKIMDTRKTLPGLRMAQKFAVTVGGGHNQRIGLFDGVLIKENHIMAAGGIRAALQKAFQVASDKTSVQIEVENMGELSEALDAGARLVLLDNFNLDDMREAVQFTARRAELEASGGINLQTVRAIAETGIDRISIGSLTKDVKAIDLSMRFI
ncbi:MAG: carboxylating nicotinate-nucleotide diphosphorylase [Gallionellaceae bacterium]|nr:carboxylating nicotinate-nucleotide diphosphorylase [Gallionellaceae bacterium]